MQNKCNTKIGFNNKVLSLRKIHFQSLTSLFLHFPNYKLAKQGKTLLHIFPYPLFFHLYTYFLFHKETEDDNISHCEENTLELDEKLFYVTVTYVILLNTMYSLMMTFLLHCIKH